MYYTNYINLNCPRAGPTKEMAENKVWCTYASERV